MSDQRRNLEDNSVDACGEFPVPLKLKLEEECRLQ
jgi:hypothetical protein